MGGLSRSKSVLMLATLIILWAVSWPIYKVALLYTPPILFAGMRTLLGGILMGLALLPRLRHIRWRQTWPIYLISAVCNAFLFYGLQTVGLRYVPEGLFTVLVYLQPVLVGVLAWIWLGETFAIRKLVGLILGFLGVGVVSFTGLTGHVSSVGIVLALATAVSWAIGTVYVKRVSLSVDAYWLVAFQCIFGGIGMTAVGLGVEHVNQIVWNHQYLTGLIYGSVFGIPVAWAVFYTLVRHGEMSKIASATFLVPLLAVVLGSLFLHEKVSLSLLLGLLLIVTSIYLVNASRPASRLSRNTMHESL